MLIEMVILVKNKPLCKHFIEFIDFIILPQLRNYLTRNSSFINTVLNISDSPF